jgi:quercetin dioxygenase-like cupin family protein
MTNSFFHDWSKPPAQDSSTAVRFVEIRTTGSIVARVHLSPGAELKAHSHPEEQIFYVLEGCLRYRVGEEERLAGAGTLIVMPGGVPHWGRAEGDTDAVFIEIKQRAAP